MRVQTDLTQEDFKQLKKESKEVLGLDGELFPPFGATQDYVEFHIFDMSGNFKERGKSENYTLEDGKIVLNIGQDFRDLGYNRGNYRIRYFFVRPKAGSGDEIVLTKTVDGNVGIIHSGNPELTGVPMGEFHVDDEGNAFVGLEPPLEGEALSLDIKEWKYQINAISSDRKEVSLIPQIIDNVKYKENFRKLASDTNTYRSTKTAQPTNAQIQEAIQEAMMTGQDPQDILANLEGDTGGEISFTGPDSSRVEFNSRLENVDGGFTQTMRRGKLVVKDAYITDYTSQPDVNENSSFDVEQPIPELYIEIIKTPGTRVVDFQLKTKDGDIFNPNINAVQFYWEFGCGHTQEASTDSNASHEYDVDGNYTPSVYVFTPNFSEEISELRTPTGRVVGLLDSSPSELPTDGSENTQESQDTSEEPLPILESAFDGKIIKWNGNGLAPFYSAGNSRSTAGTRWWVQNGHTRALASNSQNLQDALRGLVGQKLEDDIELSRDIINDLRIGPNLDYTNFGNPTENEIQRIINVDWRSPGNPDDFQTNRNAREEQAAIPNTYEVRITGFLTIETQGDDQFDQGFDFETDPLIFPSNMSYTAISSNVSAFETPTYDGDEAILLRFEEGQNVTLTFPSVVNIGGSQSISLSRVDMDGGTTNSSARTATFTMNGDKEIEIRYGIEP